MSTLDIKNTSMTYSDINASKIDSPQKKYKKTTHVYIGVAIFCIVFNTIYEHFSYGEYSLHMRYMFIAPILFGIIPFTVATTKSKQGSVCLWESRISYNLWNCGIATLLSGCIVRGIINISGRYSDYDIIYRIGTGLFFIVSILLSLKNISKQKKQSI